MQLANDGSRQFAGIDRGEPGRTFLQDDFAVVEQILDQVVQVLRLLDDQGESFLEGGVGRVADALPQVLDEEGDGGGGVADRGGGAFGRLMSLRSRDIPTSAACPNRSSSACRCR